MRGMKIGNEYAQQLRSRYAKTPKAVLAAVVVSLLVKQSGKEDFDGVLDAFVQEWAILHQNGIVSQKPLILNKNQEPNA
jgi:hypothetical protein